LHALELVEKTASRLEQEYDDEKLDAIVRNKGVSLYESKDLNANSSGVA